MKKLFYLLLGTLSLILLFSDLAPPKTQSGDLVGTGVVTSVIRETNLEEGIDYQLINVQLPDGSTQTMEEVDNYTFPREYRVGDELQIITTPGGEPFIGDFVRIKPLIYLFVLFAIVVLFIARRQGLAALFGMIFSFLVLFKLVLPLILSGTSPLIAAFAGIALIIPANFYSAHGLNRRTTTAIFSSILTLAVGALLAFIFVDLARISGTASEEVIFLSQQAASQINFQGLFLAGLLISLIGILDDITISQVSIVHELRQANPKATNWQLFTSAMNVGKNHIASLVNTLLLVYAGAALPLLLLFLDNNQQFFTVINNELLAEEILRTLIGSIALVLAVPITTALAVEKKGNR